MDLDRTADIRVICAPSLAPFAADEAATLGFAVGSRARTGVTVSGTWRDAWRLCLELRTAISVLYPLETFACRSPDELYERVRAMGWERLLGPSGYLTVESTVDHPSINNSMFPNLRVKDAIVDRLAERTGGRPDTGPKRIGAVVHLFWRNDRATVSLNAAGRKLADRGYRKRPHKAPLQETLAAAVVLASGWRGDAPLALPMCGSGTLAVEAALIGLDRAPGLLRPHFGFERFAGFDEQAWTEIRAAARRRARKRLDVPIVASDIDPRAIEAARANAETAGVAHLIEFHVADFERAPLPGGPGVLIVNPEYGGRLGRDHELEGTYERLGRFFKGRCADWSCHVLSGNRDLSGAIGLKAARRVPLFNADIECRLLRYDVWPGTRQPESAT